MQSLYTGTQEMWILVVALPLPNLGELRQICQLPGTSVSYLQTEEVGQDAIQLVSSSFFLPSVILWIYTVWICIL